MNKLMQGVIVAMTTPFRDDGSIDLESLKNQVDFLIGKGVNCLYPLGTTGEMFLLTVPERKLVAQTVVEQAAGRLPVYIHVGALRTSEACELAVHAHKIGACGIAAVTPAYFSCSPRAIAQYYKDLAAAAGPDFPLYLYAIPQCAANDISSDLAAELAAALPQVVGIKYSGSDMLRLLNYISIRGGSFSVLTGSDRLFFSALTGGAQGMVSGCAGPLPEPFVAVYQAWQEGRLEDARRLQRTMTEVVELLGAGADMAVFKEVLRRRGVTATARMRRPLLELEPLAAEKLWQGCQPYLGHA